ncbi:MAG: type I-E CRISPR-associated protein Cas5/CasD, partial [Myxococcota bacterium]
VLGMIEPEHEPLNRLQERIRYAACRERAGVEVRDFQTVDFSEWTGDLSRAKTIGWTTRGAVEQRAGSNDTLRNLHIRYRDYWADARYLVALTLEPASESPSLEDVERALRRPERPLFVGRKACLPSRPILSGRVESESLVHALVEHVEPDGPEAEAISVWWEARDLELWGGEVREFLVTDERDWRSQLHGGERHMRRSTIRRSVGATDG